MRPAALTLLLVLHLLLALRENLAGAGLVQHGGDHAALAFYGRFTGLACTYGFFAPRVASPCFLEITTAAGIGSARHTHTPRFVGNDARLRYRSFTTAFLDLAPGDAHANGVADTAYRRRLARAFARSIAEREAGRLERRPVSCRVYVYRHPSLREYAKGLPGRTVNLYAYGYPTR